MQPDPVHLPNHIRLSHAAELEADLYEEAVERAIALVLEAAKLTN